MISEPEWESIRRLIMRLVPIQGGRRDSYFTTGKVVKRDELKKLVWLDEFGDQPIPIVAFNYKVTYYDETPRDTIVPAVGANSPFTTKKRQTRMQDVQVLVPEIGDTVVVARELGAKRLPRCIGIIQGVDWIISEEDDSFGL